MNRAISDAFIAGFNAGRSIHGDSTDVKKQFEAAWQRFVASLNRRNEAQYRKANRRAEKARKD